MDRGGAEEGVRGSWWVESGGGSEGDKNGKTNLSYTIQLALELECCYSFVAVDTLVVMLITQWLLWQRQLKR